MVLDVFRGTLFSVSIPAVDRCKPCRNALVGPLSPWGRGVEDNVRRRDL